MSGLAARRHRKRKLKSEINVVPYIDVMLVLLIIFMVTAPLLTLGIDVDLPNSNAKSIETKNDPVVVQVDKDGNYFLTVKAGKKEGVSRQTLLTRVRALVAENEKGKLQVYVGGDGNVKYQIIMDAIDTLKDAGVEKVGLMSQPEKGAAQ
ncbi:protein TolR [Lysobacter silvisoli]|uniref:Tol-Pal system protein TolR n=1 Tax=Lysobacter silvisoli TaxID=2293254 RepID=A0A371K6T1_9GAMM|nr:protein TolR [Lysobacter silvisoli]RDZ29550.1 protein TolR [Lysobacter silvisoli]